MEDSLLNHQLVTITGYSSGKSTSAMSVLKEYYDEYCQGVEFKEDLKTNPPIGFSLILNTTDIGKTEDYRKHLVSILLEVAKRVEIGEDTGSLFMSGADTSIGRFVTSPWDA